MKKKMNKMKKKNTEKSGTFEEKMAICYDLLRRVLSEHSSLRFVTNRNDVVTNRNKLPFFRQMIHSFMYFFIHLIHFFHFFFFFFLFIQFNFLFLFFFSLLFIFSYGYIINLRKSCTDTFNDF